MGTKEKIINIAAKFFSKGGYKGVTMDMIAKEVGITKAALYYHFKDKSHLYQEVLTERFDRLVDFLDSVKEADAPTKKLQLYIERFGLFLEKNPCFAAILAHEFADNGAHMGEHAIAQLSKTLRLLTAILNEGIEVGEFEMENPMVVQMMVVSTLIMHQTTKDLRAKVTTYVDGFEVVPEPTIENIAKILAKKIIKSIRTKI